METYKYFVSAILPNGTVNAYYTGNMETEKGIRSCEQSLRNADNQDAIVIFFKKINKESK